MKYSLIGENDLLNPLETIFKNRGISDFNKLLELDESVVISHKLLVNIDKAVDCLLDHIDRGSKIFVQTDSDADGYTSSAILINYLTKAYPKVNIQWRLQEGKEHGIVLDTVPNDVKVVIVPDAGSNQFEEHKILKERGVDVIVIDHHECEEESEDAIVVNSQLSPEYTNKNFSGAGITYKVCKALDEKLGLDYADFYLDLVAIGNIGDMMDLREPETRHYVKKGLEQINNSLLRELIKKQEYSMKGVVNIINVSFYITPLINAAVRAASMSEKRDMMKSFLESKEHVFYKRQGEYESIQVATARNLYNVRNRQNKLRDKGLESIEAEIHNKDLLKNPVLFLDVTELLDKKLTGLVSNRLSQKYKRPSVLYRSKGEGLLGGSARGYESGHIKDFRNFLLDTDKFVFCEGHNNAFGIELKDSNLEDVKNIVNEKLSGIDIDLDIHEVDLVVNEEDLNQELITGVAEYQNEWGSKITEPLLAFVDIPMSREDIFLVGKLKNTIKMKYKGIEFIKRYTNEEYYNSLFLDGETFYLTIIGKCKINTWEGVTTPQVDIVDMELTDTFFF